jgi:hypothetical protein
VWTCPHCKRQFTRRNQRHACGTGDRRDVLRNRPPEIVALYNALESYAKSLGKIEVVARERYVLLRTVRIFADLVIMSDALRVAIHIGRTANDSLFFKVGGDTRATTHVAKLKTLKDLAAIKPYLTEAYEYSLQQTGRPK